MHNILLRWCPCDKSSTKPTPEHSQGPHMERARENTAQALAVYGRSVCNPSCSRSPWRGAWIDAYFLKCFSRSTRVSKDRRFNPTADLTSCDDRMAEDFFDLIWAWFGLFWAQIWAVRCRFDGWASFFDSTVNMTLFLMRFGLGFIW